MVRDLRLILEDILTAIRRIEEVTADIDYEEFGADWRTQYIVERGLMIISEASRAIPEELKARHTYIRWTGVRDIGNVLRHQYASLSATLLWNVVKDELPSLRVVIERLASPTEK